MPLNQNKIKNLIKKNEKKAFSFSEIIITLSLFFIIAGVSLGAYFEYYRASLIKTDISSTFELIKNARFQALKNPTNSSYGIHIDSITGTLTSFRDIYNVTDYENVSIELRHLDITDLNLNPTIGTTNEIIFETQTGKTSNFGSFTMGNDNFSNIIYINPQGVVE